MSRVANEIKKVNTRLDQLGSGDMQIGGLFAI